MCVRAFALAEQEGVTLFWRIARLLYSELGAEAARIAGESTLLS